MIPESFETRAEEAALDYVNSPDCEVMDTYSAHRETFLAGARWGRSEGYREAIETVFKEGPTNAAARIGYTFGQKDEK